jgi:hypothetical protein
LTALRKKKASFLPGHVYCQPGSSAVPDLDLPVGVNASNVFWENTTPLIAAPGEGLKLTAGYF